MTVVAIHQPNFFPWLGYFDKIRRSDVFVFLDLVTYPKSGSGMGTIVNRVRININGKATWIGCPVVRQRGPQRIIDVEIDDRTPWREKVLRSIELTYKRSIGFSAAMPLLRELVLHKAAFLADFNVHTVESLVSLMGLKTRLVRQSRLGVEGKATELLIAIVKQVQGTAYLCGGGAAYQEDELFRQSDLELVYQAFEPKPYGDASRFIPGLSIVDFLMNTEPSRWALA